MVRNRNENLPLNHEGQNHLELGTQQTGNTYDVRTFPRLFGEVIGRRIGTTYGDSNYCGCLVKQATIDEFQVEILVQRSFKDPNFHPDVRLRATGSLVLTMRYEGRIDGIDQFVMKGLESRTWTVGVNHYGDIIRRGPQCPNYDIGIFGVSEDTLRHDYGTFFRVADADAVDAHVGSPHPDALSPSNCLGIPCDCR